METISLRPRKLLALVCVALLAHGESALLAQEAPQQTPSAPAAEQPDEKLSPDQLDSLVAPIALYPDPLLAQTLAASTYPLEVIQLSQWLGKNKDLKDKALADAVAKQPWDPAVQSMAAVPEVVKRLADDIQWTTELGDAFLDQQGEVMDAVQRMRKKAEDKGALKSNEQQTVETKVVQEKTVIVVQPTNPEVVYVPSYNPTVVYPPPVYPYPPVYYPPYYPGAGLVTFGVGMAMGAAIWGGSCCGCSWGGGNNTININNNNNFNRNSNVNRNTSGNRGGSGNWQHNSQHRGGAPYSNKATASKYGGSARGQSGTRQASNRGAGASASSRGAGAGAGSRGGGASASSRTSGAGAGGGGRAGASASASKAGGGSRSGGFGGGSGGYSGSSARSSSSRGSSSMSSRGGGSRGGGGGGRRR